MATEKRTVDQEALRIADYLRDKMSADTTLGITINSVRDIDVKDFNINDFPAIVVYRINWSGYRCDKSRMICKLILTQSAGNGGVRFHRLAQAVHELLHDFQYEPNEELDIDSRAIESSVSDINVGDKAYPALITRFNVTYKHIEGGLSWPGLT